MEGGGQRVEGGRIEGGGQRRQRAEGRGQRDEGWRVEGGGMEGRGMEGGGMWRVEGWRLREREDKIRYKLGCSVTKWSPSPKIERVIALIRFLHPKFHL
jgi:hypothetical protein